MIVNQKDVEKGVFEKVSVEVPTIEPAAEGKVATMKIKTVQKERLVINSNFPCACGKFPACFRHGVSPDKKQDVSREK